MAWNLLTTSFWMPEMITRSPPCDLATWIRLSYPRVVATGVGLVR